MKLHQKQDRHPLKVTGLVQENLSPDRSIFLLFVIYFLFSNYLLSLMPHRFLSFAVSPFHLIFFYHTVYPLLHRFPVYSNPLREGRICCRIFSHVSWVNWNRFFIGSLGATFLLWSQEQGISQCFPWQPLWFMFVSLILDEGSSVGTCENTERAFSFPVWWQGSVVERSRVGIIWGHQQLQ